jgi:hypothetical protein
MNGRFVTFVATLLSSLFGGMSRSPGTEATIDVNIPGLNITKLKFNP